MNLERQQIENLNGTLWVWVWNS